MKEFKWQGLSLIQLDVYLAIAKELLQTGTQGKTNKQSKHQEKTPTPQKPTTWHFYLSSKSQLASMNSQIIQVRTAQKNILFSSIVLKHYHLQK